MLMIKMRDRVGRFLLPMAAFMVMATAGPAFAGNVYSWVTEDGTHAFTDDPKRIPAKHKLDAQQRPMGDLSRYERFTRINTEGGTPYAERIRARQNALRANEAGARTGAIAGTLAVQGTGLTYSVPAGGGNGRGGQGVNVQVPIGGTAAVDAEPTTVQSIRVKPSNSMASSHWTVIKQGDRITSVIKGESNQTSLDGPDESDFDL